MLDVARGLHFLHSTGVVHRQVSVMRLTALHWERTLLLLPWLSMLSLRRHCSRV